MTAKMRSFFEKRKWNDKRDTPQASIAPCRLHFLMFSALHAEKAALLRRKNAFGRTTALLAPRMPSQNKKAIPYGMTFCFGGDKRDRTADLMTASCYRFVIWSVFASNTSVPSTKSAGFFKVLSIASTRFRAHLEHNLGQFFAAGYSLQSRREGGSSSSIFGKRPTGGLKRLSVLSSLHWLTSPSRTAPVPGSTSKS